MPVLSSEEEETALCKGEQGTLGFTWPSAFSLPRPGHPPVNIMQICLPVARQRWGTNVGSEWCTGLPRFASDELIFVEFCP